MRQLFCEATSKPLRLPDQVERVVSLSPALTESVYRMGLGHLMVGVSAFDVHPEEARKLPLLGSYSSTNLDKLSSLKPEVILLTTGYQRHLAMALSNKYSVYAIDLPATVAGIIDQVAKVGLVLGYVEKGRSLSKLLHGVVSQYLGVVREKVKVYVEIDLGGPVTFGAYSYITDALELVGAENIFGGDPCEWERPDYQRVLAAQPDHVIYEPKMFRRVDVDHVSELLASRGLDGLRALGKHRLHVTPGPYDFLAHHGPSFIETGLKWLSAVVRL